jgi:hypothetical protein
MIHPQDGWGEYRLDVTVTGTEEVAMEETMEDQEVITVVAVEAEAEDLEEEVEVLVDIPQQHQD